MIVMRCDAVWCGVLHVPVHGGAGEEADGPHDGGGAGGLGALIKPCATCAGSMALVHTGCLQRYLHTAWATACPNCQRPYPM